MVYPDGVTRVKPDFNTAQEMAVVAFTAIAFWNVIELNIQVFLTFKRHRGLYFWSLIISSWGCLLHALGFLLKFLILTDPKDVYLSVTIITIGWYCMVTGQSIVLYSRLHLVVREQKVLRGILAMIIVDAICFHIPTTVLTYASNSANYERFISPFNAVESLQMTAFCIQEFIISGVYVYSTLKLLRPSYNGRARKVMMSLIWINLIIIAMDIGLLAMEYSKNYDIEAASKAMFYSIKLKLELAVLNQLMTLANSSVNHAQNMHIQDQEAQSPISDEKEKPDGYWSRCVTYPQGSEKPVKHSSNPFRRSRSASSVTDHAHSHSLGGHPNRNRWIPSLDRNCIVKTTHIENVSAPPNEFTNPAACYQLGKANHRFPPHDGLGGISDSPPVSPTLTGTTLDHPSRPSRHRPSPPHLDLAAPPVLSNGVFRSSRPSVTDWAPDPGEESSPNADDPVISPFDKTSISRKKPGSVTAGRGRAEKSLGMDFMTSALHA
ncbi:hypothetical protein MMC07_009706 [Pseudocyphellaria aurata]|nr:hypothetical protein [Pseudocyphellaria aurata]